MSLVSKEIKWKNYYYSFLRFRLAKNPKSFSKYIGATKPGKQKLKIIENNFKKELTQRLAGRTYSAGLISPDEVIRSLLFRDLFREKYTSLTELKRRKYDIDRTVSFTLTTLTTEDVNVDIDDVENALKKRSALTEKEEISKNMLKAVESIKHKHTLTKEYLLELHKTIMSGFETKTPGSFRNRRVHLYRYADDGSKTEIAYRAPVRAKIEDLVQEFCDWYNKSDLNPIEKAALSHYKLYRIHPFLDGNKRICRLIFNKTLIENGFPLLNISVRKEAYFDALIESVENGRPKALADFALNEYYKQVRDFLSE